MTEKVNRQWRLAARPEGLIKEGDFKMTQEAVSQPGPGQILVRNIYLSLDPANRGWITDRKSYVEPVEIGDVMRGLGIGVVEASNNEKFNVGEHVTGLIGWQDYLLSDGEGMRVVPPLGLPLTTFLGALGMVGITAYFGLLDITDPQEGETLVVSGAAGAVGSLVGQIGKIKGCRVVGIAGTDEKCQWIKDELGFDAAINYKTENIHDALKKHCPKGIDIYFDNVGGDILNEALGRINFKGRISICGMISQYNATEPVPGPTNLINLLAQRARMEGFIVMDYMSRANEALTQLGAWMMQGQLKFRVDVVDGLETAPLAINKLFDGSNKGKLIVKISDES